MYQSSVFKVLLALAVLSFALSHALAEKAPAPRIGYGSSTAVVTAKIQENFFMGFELGFESILGKKRASELLLVNQSSDGSQLGAVRSAENLIKQGAIALIGFPSSHDSLLAAKVAEKNQVFSLYAGSGHSNLAKKGKTVFTTGASMQSALEGVFRFIQKKYPDKKGLAIINPYAVFSLDQEKVIDRIRKRKDFSSLSLKSIRLNKKFVLSEGDFAQIRSADYLFLTPYPEELVPFMNQLVSKKVDLPMFAGSSWGTADPDIMRRFLAKSHSPFYMGAEWVKGQSSSSSFEKLAKAKYGREPNSEMAFGYDVGLITAKTINRVKGTLNKRSLVQAFYQNSCFNDLTIGQICFPKQGGHADRPVVMTRFTKSGFLLLSQLLSKGARK